jgi:hypothetical protein
MVIQLISYADGRPKLRRQAIGPMGPSNFAAMQHEPDIRWGHPAIKQIIVQCTKLHGGIAGWITTAWLTQGVARKPFNFYRFRADSVWTGTATKT